MFSMVNWLPNIGRCTYSAVFWPVRTSPARCGRSGGSGWVWLCNLSVRPSYRLRLQPMPPPPPLPQLTRPLSPARTRPPPAACCPVASAGHREAPPPGRHGYSTLERNKQERLLQQLWIYWVWHEGSGLIDPQRIHSFWWIVFEAETKKMGKAAVDFAKFYGDIIKLHLIHIMSFPLSAAALRL